MRVTRDKLIDLAKSETKKRAEGSALISAYIIGSVASGNPILGGTADVDLVLIHNIEPPVHREFLALSEHFHLDITHHSSDLYQKPTDLRVDPWLGPSICEPLFLHDPAHFFERAQAGVRGRFHREDYVYARAQAFLMRARELKSPLLLNGHFVREYLKILIEGTNALATLAGFPAAGRRVALILEARLESLGGNRFFERFLDLLGAQHASGELVENWVAQWDHCERSSFRDDDQSRVSRYHYYRSGFDAVLDQGRVEIVLPVLLDRWNDALTRQEAQVIEDEHFVSWESALRTLGLNEDDQVKRAEELEVYLDDIEQFILDWADQHGA